jgi:V/A-type H+-transporting ATPase subunit C
MGSKANNAIVTKAKSMFGKFLQPEDYNQMVKIQSIPELVKYLQRQPQFEDVLRDVQPNTIHRGHLEALIRKNRVGHIVRLVKMVHSKDKDFYMLDVVQQENQVLLFIIRMIINEDVSDIRGTVPFFYDIPTALDFSKLLNVKSFEDLMKAVEGTSYEKILKPFYTPNIDQIRYIDIEHALEVHYYDLVFSTIDKYYSGKLRDNLTKLAQLKIDLMNITKIYRLKKFYHADPITIRNVLVDEYSKMSNKKLDELSLIEDPDELINYIDKQHHFPVADKDDYVFIEYYTGKLRHEVARRLMYFSTDVPEIYTAFIFLSEFEVENLINIIEGIRYQVDEEEMKQMLIY